MFGVPKVDGQDLAVTFAVGSETHPMNLETAVGRRFKAQVGGA
jgi:hypothetical protein